MLQVTQNLFGLVGWSGSGKTTLLEKLLPQLQQAGLRCNVVKHSHHDVVLEPAHKDSARLRHAGAAEVLLACPKRYAIVREVKAEPSLRELISYMRPADLTLVEGYKWEPIPKIEIHRAAIGKAGLYLEDLNIIAVASDTPAPKNLRSGVLWFDLNQDSLILQWILSMHGHFLPTSCQTTPCE